MDNPEDEKLNVLQNGCLSFFIFQFATKCKISIFQKLMPLIFFLVIKKNGIYVVKLHTKTLIQNLKAISFFGRAMVKNKQTSKRHDVTLLKCNFGHLLLLYVKINDIFLEYRDKIGQDRYVFVRKF